MSDQNETPVEETQAPVEETEAPETEAVQVPQEPETESQAEEVSEPSQTNSEPEPSEEEPSYSYELPYQQPQIELQPDEDGTVNPNDLLSAIDQRMDEKLKFQQQEQRAWRQVEQKYPQISESKDLRDMLHNIRVGNVVQGGEADLVKIADNMFGQLGAAKSQGRADASVSRKVQKAASLETATANSGEPKSSQALDRIASGDNAAAESLLSEWISEGKI